MSDRLENAKMIVQWASMRCGPYSETHQLNMAIAIAKSRANLGKLAKLNPREKMHDINIIITNSTQKLFSE